MIHRRYFNFSEEDDHDPNATNKLPPMLKFIDRRSPHPEAIIYVAGYLAYKKISKLKCAACEELLKKSASAPKSDFVVNKTINGSSLTQPSNELVNLLADCDKLFREKQSCNVYYLPKFTPQKSSAHGIQF